MKLIKYAGKQFPDVYSEAQQTHVVTGINKRRAELGVCIQTPE